MDNYTMIGLGFAALLVVWLVFSLIRKIMGMALLATLALGAYLIWVNPDLRASVFTTVMGLFGAR